MDHLGGHENITHVDLGVLEYLRERFGILRMIDVGCGPGGMLNAATILNIQAVGVDGDQSLRHPGIVFHDYTTGPLPRTTQLSDFDLCWSVEFVEHLEERFIPNFMDTFQRAKYVVMTAAAPGYGGHHHVNCQSVDYWIEKMGEYGFQQDQRETLAIRKHSTMGRDFMHRTGVFYTRNEQ